MTFAPLGAKEDILDTKLQTDEEEAKLQARLINTCYFAHTSIKEQGVNNPLFSFRYIALE